MKYLMTWTYRVAGSAAENEKSLSRGLEVFSKWTPPQSTTYHQFLGRLDGMGGCSVIETDNPADVADATAKFAFIADYQVIPVVDIEEQVRALQAGVDFRESIS